MITILLRTLIIYFILISAMRIMGKRQIGQLEVSDLVTTILLSEIATLPIENHQLPTMYAVIPIITLLAFEVSLSVLVKRFPKLKKIINSSPSILISRGKINQNELKRARISIEELISEIRQNNITDIDEVMYAILEANGNVTVIPKSEYRQVTLNDINKKVKENGIGHIVIADSKINEYALKFLNKDNKWVEDILKKEKTELKNIFLMTADDNMKISIIKKEKKSS